MPKFQFLATLTVDAPSEADAQTRADIAIADADQYLGEDYRLSRQSDAITVYEGLGKLDGLQAIPTKELLPRYTVELTTEGWQIMDNERGYILADVAASKHSAHTTADLLNAGTQMKEQP